MDDQFESTRVFWRNVGLGSLALAMLGFFVRAPPIMWIGAGGIAAMGVAHYRYSEEYARFYEQADWSERWGSEPVAPISHGTQPWVNGTIMLVIAVMFVWFAAEL